MMTVGSRKQGTAKWETAEHFGIIQKLDTGFRNLDLCKFVIFYCKVDGHLGRKLFRKYFIIKMMMKES